jgi:hypothetical protein
LFFSLHNLSTSAANVCPSASYSPHLGHIPTTVPSSRKRQTWSWPRVLAKHTSIERDML